MSNFLALMASHATCQHAVEALQLQGSSDALVRPLNRTSSLLFVAKSATSQRDASTIARGFGVDHDARAVVCGTDGWRAANPAHHLEGCYVRLDISERSVSISTDYFALQPMLYFFSHGVVAISDSLMVLSELRRMLGLSRHLRDDPVTARLWWNTICAQQVSYNTIITGIALAPMQSVIHADFSGDRVRGSIDIADVSGIQEFGDAEAWTAAYPAMIQQGAVQIASLMRTFAAVAPKRPVVSVSGGSDSRVLLAAALHDPHLRSRFRFLSRRDMSADHMVVEQLAGDFNFEHEDAAEPAEGPRPLRRLSWWATANAGFYDPMYGGHSAEPGEPWIGGYGGEMFSRGYGLRNLRTIAAHIEAPAVRRAFLFETQSALETVGIAWTAPHGAWWYFALLRNTIHSGRNGMFNALSVRPLMLKSLFQFCARRPDLSRQVVTDLLVALSPELAARPFDHDKKNLPADLIDERTRVIGGRITSADVSTYVVQGDLGGQTNGPPDAFLQLAERKGFSDTLDAAGLRALARKGVAKLSDSRSLPLYRAMLAEVEAHMTDAPQSGKILRPLGKLISLNLAY